MCYIMRKQQDLICVNDNFTNFFIFEDEYFNRYQFDTLPTKYFDKFKIWGNAL